MLWIRYEINEGLVMAKAKINYDDVKKVCEQILADDEEPTARSVRAILGVGSMQTVLGFIQDWNKTRTLKEITAESIDKKLLQLINVTVSDSVKFGMSKIQEELVKATLERNDMSAEFLRLENEYNISIGEIERYKIDNTKAEERCRNLQENLAEAKSNILTLTNKNEVIAMERNKFEFELIAALEQCQHHEVGIARYEKLKLENENLAGQLAGINSINGSQIIKTN